MCMGFEDGTPEASEFIQLLPKTQWKHANFLTMCMEILRFLKIVFRILSNIFLAKLGKFFEKFRNVHVYGGSAIFVNSKSKNQR